MVVKKRFNISSWSVISIHRPRNGVQISMLGNILLVAIFLTLTSNANPNHIYPTNPLHAVTL